MKDRGNLNSGVTGELNREVSELLSAASGVRVERIVSMGQASPEGFWYEQSRHEWVCVTAGAARLKLEDPDEEVELADGDWIWIKAGRRHRVEWTAEGMETVWLAVFVPAGEGGEGENQ